MSGEVPVIAAQLSRDKPNPQLSRSDGSTCAHSPVSGYGDLTDGEEE